MTVSHKHTSIMLRDSPNSREIVDDKVDIRT
jgi:hypothetical protein